MSKIFIPEGRRVDVTTTHSDMPLNTPRNIANSNIIRGLFLFELTDSFDATRPRRWEFSFKGGFQYDGPESKYFPILGSGVNVDSITTVSSGYTYDIVDDFGNTYRLSFNGAKDFTPTITRTAVGSLTGPVTFRVILFSY